MNSRREFLTNLSVAACLPLLSSGCGYSEEESDPGVTAAPKGFSHGVASGDPYPESVVLWTRYTPEDTNLEVLGAWELALDRNFLTPIASGEFSTDRSRDFTIKIVANGLASGTTYYYRFRVGNLLSPLGRTRTATVGLGRGRLRFAVTSCASYDIGYFNVYAQIAKQNDLDAHICLGDYIYEHAIRPEHPDRTLRPRAELTRLSHYRERHGLYKQDVDLQACHQQHPLIAIWDDHEIADNANTFGSIDHQASEGNWGQRKAAAIRAYFEWMPVRDEFNPLTTPDAFLYRRFQYGDLADIFMLETRLESRDTQAVSESQAQSTSRKLISNDQEAWLFNGLSTSTAAWKLVGQQTLFAQLFKKASAGGVETFNFDAWDGYTAQRNRFHRLVKGELVPAVSVDHPAFAAGSGIDNVVILTGDTHVAFAMDITDDPHNNYDSSTGTGAFAVEFVTPPTTSRSGLNLQSVVSENPHIQYARGSLRGYLLLDIDSQRCQGEWYFTDTIAQRSAAIVEGGVLKADNGSGHLSMGQRSIPDPVANSSA